MGLQTTEEVADMGPQVNGKHSRPVFGKPSKPKFGPRSNNTEFPALKTQSGAANSANLTAHSGSRSVPQTGGDNYDYVKVLTGLMALSKCTEIDVLAFLRKKFKWDESLTSLAQVFEKQRAAVIWAHNHWKFIDQELTKPKQENPA